MGEVWWLSPAPLVVTRHRNQGRLPMGEVKVVEVACDAVGAAVTAVWGPPPDMIGSWPVERSPLHPAATSISPTLMTRALRGRANRRARTASTGEAVAERPSGRSEQQRE